MTAQQSAQGSSGTSPAAPEHSDLPPIKAIKLRHPLRWIIAAILVFYAVGFVVDAAVNRPVYDWATFGKYIFDQRISEAALVTLLLTIYSMILAIVLGIILAVMRLSPNPIFKSIAWLYLWLFRGTPVYVQLVFWGLLATVYPTVMIGLPFMTPIFEIPTDFIPVFWIAHRVPAVLASPRALRVKIRSQRISPAIPLVNITSITLVFTGESICACNHVTDDSETIFIRFKTNFRHMTNLRTKVVDVSNSWEHVWNLHKLKRL